MRIPKAHLLAMAGLLLLVIAKYDDAAGFTPLIRFGETSKNPRLEVINHLPVAMIEGSNGYDGQFYAQLALDPLLQQPELAGALDVPAYRARRILMPATAATLGLGQPWPTLQAFALINVACWLALGWLLHARLVNDDHGPARWFGCMFALGVLDSVRQSLVDLPALLLLALSVHAYEHARERSASIWGALGNLTKETNLLGFVALQTDVLTRPRPWRRFLVGAAIAAGPLALWSFYVHSRLGGDAAGVGFGNFTWPGVGIVTHIIASARGVLNGDFDSRFTFGLLGSIALLIQATWLWFIWRPAEAWWRIGAAYSILMILLSAWVWSSYWAACRAVLPMTIAFNLLLPGKRGFWPWWILGNITVLHGVWRFL